jgi:hypothetical protein
MRVRIIGLAEQDLLRGYDFYDQQQEGVGSYFLDSLYSDIDSLALYGGIHLRVDARIYRALAKRFPFSIYYDKQGDEITVIAVLDYRQNPTSITKQLEAR